MNETRTAIVGTSPMTIDTYGLDTKIHAAQQRQAETDTLSAKALGRRMYEDMLYSLRRENARLHVHNTNVRTQADLIDYNVSRLGTDPEELYRPWPKPDPSLSHAGQKRSGRNRDEPRRARPSLARGEAANQLTPYLVPCVLFFTTLLYEKLAGSIPFTQFLHVGPVVQTGRTTAVDAEVDHGPSAAPASCCPWYVSLAHARHRGVRGQVPHVRLDLPGFTMFVHRPL
jgi:hypothetical protein